MDSVRTISCLVLIILGLLVTEIMAADHMLIPPKANCSSSQFQCANGGCIELDDVCDCFNQCGDKSDEQDCNDMLGAGHGRSGYAYYCPGGECIQYFQICNSKYSGNSWGDSDCDDMSDEKNCSDVAPCNKLQFECSNGKCIRPMDQCNGINNCGDWSDEINCFGKCKYFECNNGKCLWDDYICNCKDECGDGSDENNCSGKTFHCPNGTCLLNSDVCNCENDCGDGADEENCDGSTFHCPNGTCLLSSKICNCEDDCGDGADEGNCENGCQQTNEEDFRFWCNHSEKYLLKKYLNDGFNDCGDEADGNYCSAESFNCGIEGCLQNISICENDYGCTNRSDEESCIGSCQEFQCPGGGPCIHNRKVCDCNDDCGDGADEKNCKGLYTKPYKYLDYLDSWETYKFHCGDGKCLSDHQDSDSWTCNGMIQCNDWSDEMECDGKCRGFQCPSGRCLPSLTYLCDGINDCGDWTDENNCPDVGCKDFQFQCTSGECIHENFVCGSSGSAWCRDGSDRENCDWRADLRCGKGFSRTKHYKSALCNPFGNYPCCSDQGWCGSTEDHCACPDCIDYRVCTDGSTYQTNNGKSNCTCINGKYECKEKGCIKGSAIILDDGCNYCICNNGTYEFCTERTCKSNELVDTNEESTHQAIGGLNQPANEGSIHPGNEASTHPDNEDLKLPGDLGEEP